MNTVTRACGSRSSSMALFMALAVLSACSDSPLGTPESRLTEAEVSELIDALGTAHAFDAGFEGASPWSCPGGGRAAHAISRSAGLEGLRATGTASYRACRVGAWALDGELAISIDFELDPFGRVAGATGTSEGRIQWERAGQSGECAIDLSVGLVQESLSVSGSACGRSLTAHPVS